MTSRTSKAVGRTAFQPTATLKAPVSETHDHIMGSATAKVTLVEYGDYQCPFCGEAYAVVKRIQERYGEDLLLVFRNFPLPEVHPRAEFAAELAEAAGAQGKFWEMHDFIYENQGALRHDEVYLNFARTKLGLDAAKMAREVEGHVYAPRIREDFISGIRSGVNGTPTFFINGTRHDDSYEFTVMTEAIDSVLKKR
jgi:protein-disulfide isomerase